MIQDTALRLEGVVSSDRLYVVTGAAFAGLAREQLPDVPVEQILVEPSGRNTAPAIGLACVHLRAHRPTGRAGRVAGRPRDPGRRVLSDSIGASRPSWQRRVTW